MQVRKVILNIHLTLSLLAGLFIVVLSLTGTVLVFKNELTQAMYPELFKVTQGERISYQDAQKSILSQYPEAQFLRIYTPDEPVTNGSFLFWINNDGERVYVYMDPATGNILGTLDESAFPNKLSVFHRNLLLEKYHGFEIVGIVGFMFTFILISGLYLWWPGIKSMAQGFKRRKATNPYIKKNDLHRLIGVYSIPVLLIIAFTGAVYPFSEKILGWFGTGWTPPAQKLAVQVKPEGRLPVDELVRLAEQTTPSSKATLIILPAKPEKNIDIRLTRSYDPGAGHTGNVKVWMDPYNGQVLEKWDPKINNVFYQTWVFPLHTGAYGGIITKVLYSIVGLMPSILMFTGIYIWQYKKRRRKKQQAEVQLNAS
ncbi:PepSY domain-containing protein [Paenibacillus sp. 7124]|uniref:PepSY domain-containing protein n=1 Tax=Paenibacillus apii TaxID=1850370 RepID=A0A6M1PN29_9BACL|nr:PepSY-associated TM helix domain-containing protein [Paenibacillus apii]NGM83894.1 PepSY domain-containing protein [Paenibacillus apii]